MVLETKTAPVDTTETKADTFKRLCGKRVANALEKMLDWQLREPQSIRIHARTGREDQAGSDNQSRVHDEQVCR